MNFKQIIGVGLAAVLLNGEIFGYSQPNQFSNYLKRP